MIQIAHFFVQVIHGKHGGTQAITDLDWTSIIFNLIGGLGIFMYGMRRMSRGLQELAGERIKQLFEILTGNPFMGILVGLGVTSLIQSSSATSVMVVGFINAGLMELTQAVGIIMGANIGTTITSWIIVIKITRYALLILGVGVAMYLFSKNQTLKIWGQFLLGFGMLFLGLKLMETAFYPLRSSPDFMPFFAHFGADTPAQTIKSVLAGVILTLVVQSSSTTIGITIALANQGLISYAGAAALVLGENIGTTVTMNLAAIGANTNAKRSARFHFLFNCIGVIYMIALFPWFIQIVDTVVPGPMDYVTDEGIKPYIAAHIAAGHSIFNIFNTIIMLPFAGILVKIATWLVPGKKEKVEKRLEFINYGIISVPSIAIGEAKKEIVHMSQLVTNMFKWTEHLLFENPVRREISDKVFKYENIVDRIQNEISHFLARLLQSSPGAQVAEDTRRYLRIAEEYESIADYCEMLAKYAIRKEQQHIAFSNDATEGLLMAHHELRSYLALCTLSFVEERSRMLHEIISRSKSIQKMIKQLRNAHIDRLDRQECEVGAGLLYTDILAALQNIRSHCRNVGEAISGIK